MHVIMYILLYMLICTVTCTHVNLYMHAHVCVFPFRLPPDLTDPVTLEPIRELSAPPFEMPANGVMHYFDGAGMAIYHWAV